MLILLTGSEAIGKKHLARFIVNELNTFNYNGHSINFKQELNGNTITEIDGVVLGEELDDDGLSVTITWAAEFYNDVFNGYGTLCHKFDVHGDEYFDIGVNKDHIPMEGVGNLLHTCDVLETYRDKPAGLDTVVVSGTFSSHYIQMLKDELKDDFIAYNIVRNPSTALLLNKKCDEFFESDTKPDSTITIDFGKLDSTTMITGALTSRTDLCETIKFEDIIKTGLVINGTKINLGEGYVAFNDYITVWEMNNHFEQDLTDGNNAFVNYDPLWFDGDTDGALITPEEVALINDVKLAVPDMFKLYEGCNYGPLTYEEITVS